MRSALLLLLAITGCSSVYAQSDTLVLDTVGVIDFTSSVRYFRDDAARYQIEHVLSGRANALFNHPVETEISTEKRRNILWGKVVIINRLPYDATFFVFAKRGAVKTDTVEWYYTNPDLRWQRVLRGNLVEARHKVLPAPEVVFPSGVATNLYFRLVVDNYRPAMLRAKFELRPIHQVLKQHAQERLFVGWFYGVLTTIVVFCAVFGFFFRDRDYLTLALLGFFEILYHLAADGLGAEYIWTGQPFTWIDKVGANIFGPITVIVLTKFSTSFLHTRRTAPVVHKLIWTTALAHAALGLFIPYSKWYETIRLVGNYIAVVWLLMLIVAGVYVALRQKKISGILFISCFSVSFVCSIIWQLHLNGIIPESFFVKTIDRIGLVLAAFLFSVAVGYNALLLRRRQRKAEKEKLLAEAENIRLVQEQNIRLEEKVAKRTQQLEAEKKKSDDLLLNILPSEVAEELKDRGAASARLFDNVTVLFTDFVNFTQAAEQMSPQQLVDELHECFKAFDGIITSHGLEKIKTIGDAYLAVAGLPRPTDKSAGRAVAAALEILQFARHRRVSKGSFEVRIGVHSGPVVAGIVGIKKFAYDIWGDTVNTAARMEQSGAAGRVNISEATYQLVKDDYECSYRGEVQAKHKGVLKMYFVERRMYSPNLLPA